MPHFDSTISLGNVIALLVMLGSLYSFHMANVKRFMTIEFRVEQMWHSFKQRFNMAEEELPPRDSWPPHK